MNCWVHVCVHVCVCVCVCVWVGVGVGVCVWVWVGVGVGVGVGVWVGGWVGVFVCVHHIHKVRNNYSHIDCRLHLSTLLDTHMLEGLYSYHSHNLGHNNL